MSFQQFKPNQPAPKYATDRDNDKSPPDGFSGVTDGRQQRAQPDDVDVHDGGHCQAKGDTGAVRVGRANR